MRGDLFTFGISHSLSIAILELARKTEEDRVDTLFLFGPNPGRNDLISKLGSKTDNLPTCGQFGLIFNVNS
jgi:phosphohistidine phosphatase